MPSYTYFAKDLSGKSIQGTMEAANQTEVIQKLRKDNLFITQITSAQDRTKVRGTSASNGTSPRGHVSLKEKMFLAKQFNVMLKAGLGMISCLNNLASQGENKYFRYVITELRKDVESGKTLSDAMSRHPKVFDRMFIYMVEAGEASGKLDLSFSRMNDYFEREYKLRKEVIGALFYPMIIVCVAIIAVIVLMTVVMPVFIDIFRDAGKDLPMITKITMGISDFLKKFWVLLPVFPVGGYFGYKAMRQNPKTSAMLDSFWLKVPLFGDLLGKLAISRFTRTLATLLDSGVPILQSLEIVQKAVNNAVVEQAIRSATISVSRGTGLAQPLESSGLFPTMVTQMVSIGEETGDLSRLLTEVADYYDKEVGYAVENLTTMIEPIIIVGLGVVIGFIVISIYLPMFDISSGATL